MASSGWQSEQTLYNYNSNIYFIGNIRVDGITHSGSSLRVWGAVALGARGTSGYSAYYNYGIEENAGWSGWNKIVGGGQSVRVGGGDYYASFDVTFGGVSPSTTSYSFPVEFKACYNSSCSSTYWDVTKYWTIYFDQSSTAPSGISVTYNSSTWDSVNITSSVSSWGVGYSGTPNLEQIVVDGSASSDNWQNKGRQAKQNATSSTSSTQSVTTANSLALSGGLNIIGMTPFKVAAWASTSVGNTGTFRTTSYYTPPAPSQFTYTDHGGVGTKHYDIEFTGVAANNYSGYTASDLTRTVRYNIDGGAWSYEENATVATLDSITSFSIAVPAGSTAIVEGWMSYKGADSEVSTLTLANNNIPSVLYGSVNGEAKAITKLYGSVNGQTKEIKKLYASVGGVTKKIFEAS